MLILPSFILFSIILWATLVIFMSNILYEHWYIIWVKLVRKGRRQ